MPPSLLLLPPLPAVRGPVEEAGCIGSSRGTYVCVCTQFRPKSFVDNHTGTRRVTHHTRTSRAPAATPTTPPQLMRPHVSGAQIGGGGGGQRQRHEQHERRSGGWAARYREVGLFLRGTDRERKTRRAQTLPAPRAHTPTQHVKQETGRAGCTSARQSSSYVAPTIRTVLRSAAASHAPRQHDT